MQDEFREWVIAETQKRGWSYRELSRRSGVASTTIMHILDQERNSSPNTVMAIAKVFRADPIRILELANIIPRRPADNVDTEELKRIYYQLDDGKRKALMDYARFMLSG